MGIEELLDRTLQGLGYELVDLERSAKGRLLRVFIDKPGGIDLDDCAVVSNHLGRVLTVENIDYERLEISSPGLDRVLRKQGDFVRFAGHKVRLKLRVPFEGRRNFVGVLREARGEHIDVDVDGRMLSFDLVNVDRARLVPAI